MFGRTILAAIAALASPQLPADGSITTSGGTVPGDDVATPLPLAPSEGGPRRWEVVDGETLRLHDAPSSDSPSTGSSGDGTVFSNLGCELVEDRAWCRVGTLRGRTRGHVPAERLRPAVGPDGTVPTGVDRSELRARKGDVDARGTIPCAQERGQAMGECTVGVARGGGGDATVVARFPNGFGRSLRFVHGEFVSADATMSGSGTDIDRRREGDLHVIRVDDQRYELHDDLIFGRRTTRSPGLPDAPPTSGR